VGSLTRRGGWRYPLSIHSPKIALEAFSASHLQLSNCHPLNEPALNGASTLHFRHGRTNSNAVLSVPSLVEQRGVTSRLIEQHGVIEPSVETTGAQVEPPVLRLRGSTSSSSRFRWESPHSPPAHRLSGRCSPHGRVHFPGRHQRQTNGPSMPPAREIDWKL
jgi:hypothetical protein